MKPTKIQKLVYSMLTENTGSHFLDSGDAYGRNFERNQKKSIKDFINEPIEKIQLYYDLDYSIENNRIEFERTVSLFHFISLQYELDSICDKFNRINKNTNDWDGKFYGVSIKGQNYLDSLEYKFIREFNTYNFDSDLSQVLQGTEIEILGQKYVLLQTHNGCDVRGGYSDAKLFCVPDFFDNYIYEYMNQSEIIDNLEYLDIFNSNGILLTEIEKKSILEILEII